MFPFATSISSYVSVEFVEFQKQNHRGDGRKEVIRMLSPDEVLDVYREYGAEWRFNYDGDRKAPHAKLSGGLCTDIYWNSDLVLSDPDAVVRLVVGLVARLRERNAVLPVDWVLGSAYGAIVLSFEVARYIGARHGFTRQDRANPERQVWTGIIPGGATVLQCEDVITSFGTVYAVRRAVEDGNPKPVRFLPDVAALIWRPRRLATAVTDVTALVARATNAWPQEECSLCKQGSPQLRPKTHWRELTGPGSSP